MAYIRHGTISSSVAVEDRINTKSFNNRVEEYGVYIGHDYWLWRKKAFFNTCSCTEFYAASLVWKGKTSGLRNPKLSPVVPEVVGAFCPKCAESTTGQRSLPVSSSGSQHPSLTKNGSNQVHFSYSPTHPSPSCVLICSHPWRFAISFSKQYINLSGILKGKRTQPPKQLFLTQEPAQAL